MASPAAALVGVTAVLNAALWLSYAVTGVHSADFGRVPAALHAYLLVAAAVAYACNLATVGLLARDARAIGAVDVHIATACVAVYYTLQLGFVPLVRAAVAGRLSRNWVRALLLAAAAPMAVLAGLGVKHAPHSGPLLPALSLTAAAHVLLNDFAVYGYLF
jgi:hypothetical protein